TGFNVFANGGMAGNRHIFLKISMPDGKVLWQYTNPNMYRVLSSRSSAYLNQMMTQVVEKGSGHRAAISGLAIAGKTGTTQSFRDAWFVGFSG
ncbi:penicillin-binding transpeptidase domain-containing protein, partial [Escherichia coli]|uniref:penicillin-binding transpeptidase domain-containing protein n=1 Tax=Escherichia coli TaxID=562 RepID=UPI0022393179